MLQLAAGFSVQPQVRTLPAAATLFCQLLHSKLTRIDCAPFNVQQAALQLRTVRPALSRCAQPESLFYSARGAYFLISCRLQAARFRDARGARAGGARGGRCAGASAPAARRAGARVRHHQVRCRLELFPLFYAGFAFAHRAAKAVLLTLLSSACLCCCAQLLDHDHPRCRVRPLEVGGLPRPDQLKTRLDGDVGHAHATRDGAGWAVSAVMCDATAISSGGLSHTAPPEQPNLSYL